MLLYYADLAPLADEKMFADRAAALPPERASRLAACRTPKARRECLGAGLLWVYALRQHGLRPDARVEYTAHGKPYLPDHPELHLNLSHAGDRVICAVASHPVGCDIERERPCDLRLAARFFTPDETAQLAATPASDQNAAFTRLWTLKESYLKATSTGLSQPLDSFAIITAPIETATRIPAANALMPETTLPPSDTLNTPLPTAPLMPPNALIPLLPNVPIPSDISIPANAPMPENTSSLPNVLIPPNTSITILPPTPCHFHHAILPGPYHLAACTLASTPSPCQLIPVAL